MFELVPLPWFEKDLLMCILSNSQNFAFLVKIIGLPLSDAIMSEDRKLPKPLRMILLFSIDIRYKTFVLLGVKFVCFKKACLSVQQQNFFYNLPCVKKL